MAESKQHPAIRFAAPASILQGQPLKELMGKELVTLIGEALAAVVPEFDQRRFRAAALRELESLELKERSRAIARAMADQLPNAFDEAEPLLVASFGPPLERTEGNGLAIFFYLPHSELIAERGLESFERGMRANYELTRRFTAEFSVRPFLVRHRERALELLATWVDDPCPHVRRLVSEGTRPRLPWGMRLGEFQADPSYTLPLLERLKDDDSEYVRRSVANHLGDLAKDHLTTILDVCERWLDETKRLSDPRQVENRRALLRHALRYPFKQGNERAIRLRRLAGTKR